MEIIFFIFIFFFTSTREFDSVTVACTNACITFFFNVCASSDNSDPMQVRIGFLCNCEFWDDVSAMFVYQLRNSAFWDRLLTCNHEYLWHCLTKNVRNSHTIWPNNVPITCNVNKCRLSDIELQVAEMVSNFLL